MRSLTRDLEPRVDRDRPFARIDHAGLLWLLDGNKLIALSENTATIAPRTGAGQTWRRRPTEPGRVLAWEFGAGAICGSCRKVKITSVGTLISREAMRRRSARLRRLVSRSELLPRFGRTRYIDLCRHTQLTRTSKTFAVLRFVDKWSAYAAGVYHGRARFRVTITCLAR
jgi:hypothetical protein